MGQLPKVDAYLWRASRNEALRRIQEIAAAITAAKRDPKLIGIKLDEIGTHAIVAAFEILNMSEIATAEVKQLRGGKSRSKGAK